MSEIAQLAAQVGLMGALVIFFVWSGWKREDRLAQRIQQLEAFVEDKLMNVIDRSTKALQDNTVALKEVLRTIQSGGPCAMNSQHAEQEVANLIHRAEERARKASRDKSD